MMTESLTQTQLIEDTNRFGKHSGANGNNSSNGEVYNNNVNNKFRADNYNSSGASQRHSSATAPSISSSISPSAVIYTVVLQPFNSQFPVKTIEINENEKYRIGRQSSAKTMPKPLNGYFNSKVLSRNHALLWSNNEGGGGVWVKDTKSSNGTFLNGYRLSAELEESEPFVLKTGDEIEFGIDITGEDGAILYHKVACSVSIFNLPVNQIDSSTFKKLNLDNGWISEVETEQQRRSSIASVATISEPSGKSTITNHSSRPVAKQNKQWEMLLASLEAEWHRSQDVEKELLGLKDALGEMNNADKEVRLKKLSYLNTSLHNQLDKAQQQLDEYAKKTRLQDQAILSAKKQMLALRQLSSSSLTTVKITSRSAGMDGSNGIGWQQQLEHLQLELAEEKRKHCEDLEVEAARCSEYEQKCKILESRLLDLQQNQQLLIKTSPASLQQNRGNNSYGLVDALQVRSMQILISTMVVLISSLLYALLVAS